jgi:O-methyltransferase involved in polyketide biosynthesis
MTDVHWVPPDIDPEIPSAARLYDYYLGGGYNFAADRELANQILQVLPDCLHMARVNRAFLRRAVLFCVKAGIRQFIDIGCGLPTVGPVHVIAQQVDPECRVLYVDNEPVAVAHSELLLDGDDRVGVLNADLRNPDAIVNAELTKELIDFSQPVAILMVAVLHFIADAEDPAGAIGAFRDLMAPGSYFAFSHVTADTVDPSVAARTVELYKSSQNPIYPRSYAEIAAMLTKFELIEPGLVLVPMWRPDTPQDAEDAGRSSFYGAVGTVR